MNLLWLFKEHRDLQFRNLELEQRVKDVEAWAAQRTQDLETQLAKRAVVEMSDVVSELFQDLPYEGGKIPAEAWLTPGLPDRSER